MVKLAVVILNWNGRGYLGKFLPNVVEYSSIPDVEVYVADNASTDDSVEFIKQNYPSVKLIVLDKNYGFADGYNKSLAQIDAEYFVLLNSDVEVTPNWLPPVIELMDQDKTIAATMPKIKSYYKKDTFEYAGAAGGFIDKYGYTFCRGRIFNSFEKDNGQYDDTKEVFWATGACLFIRAELYKSSGGLDGDFFAHMEEIDLCWRIKNMGHKIMYSPNSTVYHIGGGTLPQTNPHKTYLNFRNNLFLLYKNLAPSKLLPILFFRLILDGIAGIKFLVGMEFGNFFAVLKAHFSFFTMFSRFIKKRKHNLQMNKKYTHEEVYPRSIVFDFFFKKTNRFSDLEF